MAIYDILKYLSKLAALKQCCKALHKHRSPIYSFVQLLIQLSYNFSAMKNVVVIM